MLDLALRAKIPFIGINTDDPIHVKTILQSIAGKKVQGLPTAQAHAVGDAYLWITEDSKAVTVDAYRKLCAAGASCVYLNPDKPSNLVFDAGVLEVPSSFFVDYLKDFVPEDKIPAVVQVLKGLSLKKGQEIVTLTMARTGSVLPQEIKNTRVMLGGEMPGLYSLETDFDFYQMPPQIKEWLELNHDYFLDPTTPSKLMPKGLLLVGGAGVGKSMGARAIAKHWDVPLFRLDIGSSLNRYLGQSEMNISRNLALIEQNAPCICLLDEVEKLFGSDDEGTTTRILSQLLWWMSEHKSKVLMVLTSNDISKLPPELYRPGRIDRVIKILELSLLEAKAFSSSVYQNIIGYAPTLKRQKIMRDTLDAENRGLVSHAEVTEMVYTLIKKHKWLKNEVQSIAAP